MITGGSAAFPSLNPFPVHAHPEGPVTEPMTAATPPNGEKQPAPGRPARSAARRAARNKKKTDRISRTAIAKIIGSIIVAVIGAAGLITVAIINLNGKGSSPNSTIPGSSPVGVSSPAVTPATAADTGGRPRLRIDQATSGKIAGTITNLNGLAYVDLDIPETAVSPGDTPFSFDKAGGNYYPQAPCGAGSGPGMWSCLFKIGPENDGSLYSKKYVLAVAVQNQEETLNDLLRVACTDERRNGARNCGDDGTSELPGAENAAPQIATVTLTR